MTGDPTKVEHKHARKTKLDKTGKAAKCADLVLLVFVTYDGNLTPVSHFSLQICLKLYAVVEASDPHLA